MTSLPYKLTRALLAVSLVVATTVAAANPNATLTGRINDIPDLSTLAFALEASGLNTVFDGEDPYTIYAPSNAAFENVSAALGCADVLELASGLVDTGLLVPVLEVHASTQRRSLTALLVGGFVNTLSVDFPRLRSGVTGDAVYLASFGNDLEFPPRIIAPDLTASNGLFHIIDAVLLPVSAGDVDSALAEAGYCS